MNLNSIKARFKPGGIGRHISWLLLHSGVEAGTMTIATLLAAKWFGPVAWGQLGIVLTGVQLISMVADGFYGTVLKYVSEFNARKDSVASVLGWHFAWLSIVVLLVLAALLGLAAFVGFPASLAPAWVMLAVILATARGWRAVFDGGFRGHKEFRAPAIAGMTCSALMAGAIIGFAAAGFRVSAYLGIMAVGTIINSLWLAYVYKTRILNKSEKTGARLPVSNSEFWRYSLPLAFRGAITFLFIKVNVWLLGGLGTEYDAGQFRLADQFMTIPALILSAVLAAITPRIAEAQMHGTGRLSLMLSKVYVLMLALTLPLALFFWFNAPILTRLFPEYVPASRMLEYFAPAMAVQGVGYAASILLVQGGFPIAALLLSLIPAIANVGAAYIGFRLNGAMGLTQGSAIVHFLTYLATIVVAHRLLKLPLRFRFS